jgi:hypothetical protein
MVLTWLTSTHAYTHTHTHTHTPPADGGSDAETNSIWFSRDWVLMYCCLLFMPFAFFKNITSYTINSVLSLLSIWTITFILLWKCLAFYLLDGGSMPSGVYAFTRRFPFTSSRTC